jgi:hypothetical protein
MNEKSHHEMHRQASIPQVPGANIIVSYHDNYDKHILKKKLLKDMIAIV